MHGFVVWHFVLERIFFVVRPHGHEILGLFSLDGFVVTTSKSEVTLIGSIAHTTSVHLIFPRTSKTLITFHQTM